MAVVTYNGVTLPNADLTEFRVDAVYDDSDTDRILTRYCVGVTFTVNVDYVLAMLPENRFGQVRTQRGPAYIMRALQQELLQPRKTLSVEFNGNELITTAQQGNTGTVDAQNGPRPLCCDYVELNATTFLVNFSIEAHYWDKIDQTALGAANAPDPATNLPGNVVLSNRWEESVDLDDVQASTRVRSGKILIRSDNDKGWTADMVRAQMAAVGLPQGNFLRVSSQYTVDQSGLALSYVVRDQEVYRLPPSPSFKVERGAYRESGSKGDGKRMATCFLRLKGSPGTSQLAMWQRCSAIVAAKIAAAGGRLFLPAFAGAPNALPNNSTTTLAQIIGTETEVGLYENVVEFQMTVLLPATPQRVNGVMGPNAYLTQMPSGTTNVTPPYTLRGTAGILLQAAKYYDPSLQNTQATSQPTPFVDNPPIQQGVPTTNLNRGLNPGQAGITPE